MSEKKTTSVGWTEEQLQHRGFFKDSKGQWRKFTDRPDPIDKVIEQLPKTSLISKPFTKKSKYGNKRVTVMNHKFDSIKESEYYLLLLDREKKAEISNLKLQQKFDLSVGATKVCTYIADFTYMEKGRLVVVDVKGMKTAVYRLKKKLLKAVLNIDIKEV